MFTVLRQLYASAIGVFDPNPQVRKAASIAFAMVLLALTCAYLTAWLAQPGYEAIISFKGSESYAHTTGWIVAGMIGFVMFIVSGYMALYIIEKWVYKKTEIEPSVAAIALTIWLVIGAADVFVSWQGGSIRAHEGTRIESAPTQSASTLPYADKLAGIDQQKANLLHVYAWCGKHKTRHPLQSDNSYSCKSQGVHFASTRYTKSRYPGDKAEMDRLMAQKAEYENLQQQAIATRQQATSDANALNQVKRKTASWSLHGLSIIVYLIQLLAGGIISYFMLMYDDSEMAKRVREERIHEQEKEDTATNQSAEGYAGYQVGERAAGLTTGLQITGFHEMLMKRKAAGQNGPNKTGGKRPNLTANQPKTEVFNFYAQNRPDTTGMQYDMSGHYSRSQKKIAKAFERYVKKHDQAPTQKELAVASKMSERTLRRHLKDMGIRTKGQK